jgi:hypothetical protein
LVLNSIQEKSDSTFKNELELEKIKTHGKLSSEIATFESMHVFLMTKIIIHFSKSGMNKISVLTKSLSYEECIAIFEKAVNFFEGFTLNPQDYNQKTF